MHILAQQDPRASARSAGLRYSSDDRPGIRRLGRPKAFRYVTSSGAAVGARDRARIRALVIPPAWTGVWICADPRGHLQATGRDARGRKQYRYHPRWREARDEDKYGRLADFGRALPAIRRRIGRDLGRRGLPREKVLAAVVKLLETTFIRVGNDEYARQNRSYGLTTMRDAHVRVAGSKVRFLFRGKSGVEHQLELDDRRLARIVKQCRDLPGQELFQYLDERGAVVDVGSDDVNAYLKDITGTDFTSKDFRTWAGTVLTATLLRDAEPCASATAGKKTIARAIDEVAKRLGNTRAVCRKCYVHPAVIDAYLDGTITRVMGKPTAAESAILRLLQKRKRASARAA
jgi:DNA topoisomerase I